MLRLGNSETISVRILDQTGTPVPGLVASDFRITLVGTGGVRPKSPYTIRETDSLQAPGFYELMLAVEDLDLLGPLRILVRPRSAYEPEQMDYAPLRASSLHDATSGFAVGDGGVILSTSDGGQTWSSVTSPTVADLYDVHATGPSEAYAVGAEGTVLAWDGSAWAEVEAGSATVYRGVYSDASGEATIVGDGGEIRRLASGVTSQLDDGTAAGSDILRDVAKVDVSKWYAVGDGGTLLVSTDDGATWAEQVLGVAETLHDVDFLNPSDGWIAGDAGLVLATGDGGSNWSAQTTPVDGNLFAVGFVNVSEGWAAGDDGILVKTGDGGQTWTRTDSSQADPLRDITAVSGNSVVLIGGASAAVFVVGETTPPSFAEAVIEETVVDDISPKIDRILGLSPENYRVTDQMYDADGNLVSATIRTFPTASDAINIANPVAEYEVTAFYDTVGRLKDYRMLRTD